MSPQQISLNPETLLSAILENLNMQFFAESRQESKLLFRDLQNGEQTPFMHINATKSGEIYCNLALDHSAYVGQLNFSRFRKILATMMMEISHRLEHKEDMNVLSAGEGDMLFNIPGLVREDGATNVLVCGLRQLTPGKAVVRLLFLDPSQYTEAVVSANENGEQGQDA